MRPQEERVLVVGLGIAGALVSWNLRQAGIAHTVVDDQGPGASSRIAAGIINPITGRNLQTSPGFEHFFSIAKATYRSMEDQLHAQFWFDRTVKVLLNDPNDLDRWKQKSSEPEYQLYLKENFYSEPLANNLCNPYGMIRVEGAAQVDIQFLLTQYAALLQSEGTLLRKSFSHGDLREAEAGRTSADKINTELSQDAALESNGHGVGQNARVKENNRSSAESFPLKKKSDWLYNQELFTAVIFCEGHRARHNPWFSYLPWRIDRGQRLLVNIPELKEEHILRRRGLLAPLPDQPDDPQQIYWLGTSNDWGNDEAVATESARTALESMLEEITMLKTEVIRQDAGIRPVVRDRRPVVGIHPKHSNLAILNALGTKGVLWAPALASELVSSLFQQPIEKAVKTVVDSLRDIRPDRFD